MLIEFRALAEADHGRIRKLPLPGGDVRGLEAAPEFHEQIIDVILDVLSASAAVRPEVRAGLLKHLAENPGHPERALLDHLQTQGQSQAARRCEALPLLALTTPRLRCPGD